MPSRPGLVDLRDLSHRYMWQERQIAKLLAEAGLTPEGETWNALDPPPVVVVVTPIEEPERFARFRVWLAAAKHIVLILVPTGGPAELVELLEWPVAANVEIFDPSELVVALRRALDLAASYEAPAPVEPPPPLVHPPGPAFDLAPIAPSWLEPETLLARQLTADARLHTADGTVSLHTPPAIVDVVLADHHAAPLPDGGALVPLGRGSWRAGDEQTFEASGRIPLGFDARLPVGWTGERMSVYWLVRRGGELGFLSANDHDWPCGPAKKLYGYADNEPRRVEVAGDLRAAAFRFEHDVTITGHLPVTWRRAGDFDVADYPPDPYRAVFFVHEDAQARTDDLLDEDARDEPPPFVLGVRDEARYALGLGRPVVRLVAPAPGEGQAIHLPTFAGYAVYDRAHREVRRAPGRLLGGAAGHAVVARDGQLFRENLHTGSSHPLPAVEGEPQLAVPVPGSVNVLLVYAVGERLCARLV